ncbi:PLP-dependent aminotransferase family protein [Saccharopolyspora hattusasensis]|uniref:MocR-like pyridoxine biosynthesis transcription factor PdxR n=1 Tax=Saccharopolyspora hattusasensis TaxID=1128679 RepID=UPI003D95B8BB
MDKQTNSTHSEFPADVLVPLDRSAPRRLREQVEHGLRAAVQDGRLAAGTLLPPSRALAGDLGVSRSVIVEAYRNLIADGYLVARRGSGTRVRDVAPADSIEPLSAPTAAARFVGGLPDTGTFPRREWYRHYRAALAGTPDCRLTYPGPQGAPELRAALAGYLGRVRGVRTAPETMVITTGFTQALVLLCRVLRARGAERIAVEDPCFAFHRRTVERTGIHVVPVPVDDDGIDVARLRVQQVAAVLVAPAHSYPTGAVLSPQRRGELVRWAQRHDVLVIEDDYDAEFRYDRAPAGAVQGLDPEHVVYAGGASKTLSPALRLGWVAAPKSLVGDLVQEKFFDDMGSGLLEQLALARLVEDGGFTRHLRRVRPIYRGRRDAALKALAAHFPEVTPTGAAAGLHVYVRLPPGTDENGLLDDARARGALVEGAAQHWADPERAAPAFVLGYGRFAEHALPGLIAAIAAPHRSRNSRQRP